MSQPRERGIPGELISRGDRSYRGSAVGETYITVRLRRHPSDERYEELRLLVDTGSTYSWIPREILERLGVKATGRRRFKTISGAVVEREIGYVFVEYGGDIAPTMVVFGEKGDAAVFGLHGMESLGLEVDPTTRQIRRSEALLAV